MLVYQSIEGRTVGAWQLHTYKGKVLLELYVFITKKCYKTFLEGGIGYPLLAHQIVVLVF
jgi:hypothetical protein